jgi:RNA polymerase sigma-70 factor (ECF subfamily)
MPFTSDDASLASAARRDPQAFGVLYDRYVKRIYTYALRQTGSPEAAEDVTSAAFEKALRHLQQKGWKSGSFLAWLYRIARNEAIHQYRKGKRQVAWQEQVNEAIHQYRKGKRQVAWQEQVDGNPSHEAALEIEQEKARVRKALMRLPTRDQKLLNLRFIEGLSSAEAAEMLGWSVQKLYLHVHRALQRLRKELETETGIGVEKQVIYEDEEETP